MNHRLVGGLLPSLVVAFAVAAFVWASDRVTLQGERTIYTVDCAHGTWNGNRCTGRLVPGPRFAFRASVRRHEVIYWIRESAAPSGKYTDCTVQNRDNWSCNVAVGQQDSAAYEMHEGRPTRGAMGLTVEYHDVSKWKWWALKAGLSVFSVADG